MLSTQARKEKTAAAETLHVEADQLESFIAQLANDIANLTKAIAELDSAMAEATELCQAGKAKNEQPIADAKVAQDAVSIPVCRVLCARGAMLCFECSVPELPDLVETSDGEAETAARPRRGAGGAHHGVRRV